MKALKAILLFSLTSLYFSVGNAQSDLSDDEIAELISLKETIDGTYQFQMIDTRSLPTIQLSLFREIEKRRHDTEIIYYMYSDKMRIMILPRNQISSADFKKLEYLIFIQSNEINQP